jgi:hypothetical protein
LAIFDGSLGLELQWQRRQGTWDETNISTQGPAKIKSGEQPEVGA